MQPGHLVYADDDRSREAPFEEQLRTFVEGCQVLAGALAERQLTTRETADCLARMLPNPNCWADFLVLRSIVGTFVEGALRRARSVDSDSRVAIAELHRTTIDLRTAVMRCLVAEAAGRHESGDASMQELRAMRAIAFIEARCADAAFSTQTAARAIGVSERYLLRLLRAHYGYGFRATVRRARIKLARALLERSWDSIKEIAVKCGYSSTSQFDRDFRQLCRTTPGGYRRRYLSLGPDHHDPRPPETPE